MPGSLPINSKANGRLKGLQAKRRVRRHLKKLAKPKGAAGDILDTRRRLVELLEDEQSGASKYFARFLNKDYVPRRGCLKAALQTLPEDTELNADSFTLSSSSMSARFIRLFVEAVDEEPLWNLFSSAIAGLHHDDFPTSTRIHFLFQQFPNKSVASWHEMLKYSTAVLRRDLTTPLTGQDRTRTVKQLHSLLRHAPLKALRAATHDISSALEVITDA
ncbi:hypothetical protein FRB99_001351, partial [Tulasnella sp. 403]